MTQNYAQAWNFLKTQVSKVQDQTLRNVMMAEFRKKAIKDWGLDPETGNLPTHTDDIGLNDWEKDFLGDIECSMKFGVDMREEKRKETDDSFRKAMREYVALGNTYEDIPDDIKCETVRQAYYEEVRAKLERIDFQIADLENYARKHNIQLDKNIIGEFKC